jgi:CHASE2 domain-containing sensor protein
VAVDIVSDTWTDEHREELSSIPANCDVVWLRSATPIENDAEHFRLGDEPGGTATSISLCSGLIPFHAVPGAFVRDYLLQVPVRDDRSANSVAAHYATLVSAMGTGGTSCGFSGRPLTRGQRTARIRFSPGANFRRIPAGVLVGATQNPDNSDFRSMRALDRDGQALVLIGGTFRDGGDVYMTPIGSLPGVEVLAHALATAKSNQPIREVIWPLSLLVNLVVGSLIVLAVWASEVRVVFGVVLALTLAVHATLGICYLLFGYFGYFLPVFVSLAGSALGVMVMNWPSKSVKDDFKAFLEEYRQRPRRKKT